MSCVVTTNAIICYPKHTCVPLESYGAKVWMEYHTYLGPTFYRSENMISPIYTPSKKTWQAFDKWISEQNPLASEQV